MSSGYVYALTNPAMPGLVKIGRSVDGGRARAKSLQSTGVPQPFDVAFEILTSDAVKAEEHAHRLAKPHRLSDNREFFKLDVQKAREVILTATCALDGEKPTPPKRRPNFGGGDTFFAVARMQDEERDSSWCWFGAARNERDLFCRLDEFLSPYKMEFQILDPACFGVMLPTRKEDDWWKPSESQKPWEQNEITMGLLNADGEWLKFEQSTDFYMGVPAAASFGLECAPA